MCRERRLQRVAGPRGHERQVPRREQARAADCRSSAIGDGVVGERHHLALVFELAHVQQVGDVLEEHAGRLRAGVDRDHRSSRPSRKRLTVAALPSPTPSIVTTSARVEAAGVGRRGRMTRVVVVQPSVDVAEPRGGQRAP